MNCTKGNKSNFDSIIIINVNYDNNLQNTVEPLIKEPPNKGHNRNECTKSA